MDISLPHAFLQLCKWLDEGGDNQSVKSETAKY